MRSTLNRCSIVVSVSADNSVNRSWITMSSSVILFNKWILDTANFRERKPSLVQRRSLTALQISVCRFLTLLPQIQVLIIDRSNHPYNMASRFRHPHDPNPRANNNSSRWTQKGQNDWQSLPSSYRTNWALLQLVIDLRQSYVFISQCCLYSNA